MHCPYAPGVRYSHLCPTSVLHPRVLDYIAIVGRKNMKYHSKTFALSSSHSHKMRPDTWGGGVAFLIARAGVVALIYFWPTFCVEMVANKSWIRVAYILYTPTRIYTDDGAVRLLCR